jgi:hypothetical protein
MLGNSPLQPAKISQGLCLLVAYPIHNQSHCHLRFLNNFVFSKSVTKSNPFSIRYWASSTRRVVKPHHYFPLPVFDEAYLKEFYITKVETRPELIRHIRLAGDFNNNKMERMNGQIQGREKVMRGLERKDSPILAGYQLFHNYIRPHKALDYKTPAEVAGIKVKGRDRWLTIIQNAKANES